MSYISGTMHRYLMSKEWNRDSTIEALERRGFVTIEKRWPRRVSLTEVGLQYVKKYTDKLREVQIEDYPDTPVVSDLNTLILMLKHGKETDRDVYVYRGKWGLIVDNGNGQNPIAVMHPHLHWELKFHGSDKLRKYHITGHKGSYGYMLKSYD